MSWGPFHQMIFIPTWWKFHFVTFHFLVIREKILCMPKLHRSRVSYVICKNVVIGWSEFELAGPNKSWHRLNLNESKTKANNLNSDGQGNGSMARKHFSQFAAISWLAGHRLENTPPFQHPYTLEPHGAYLPPSLKKYPHPPPPPQKKKKKKHDWPYRSVFYNVNT